MNPNKHSKTKKKRCIAERIGHERPNPKAFSNAFYKLFCISKSDQLIQSALKRPNMPHFILELLPSFFISKMP